jgi:hypothetical protein
MLDARCRIATFILYPPSSIYVFIMSKKKTPTAAKRMMGSQAASQGTGKEELLPRLVHKKVTP